MSDRTRLALVLVGGWLYAIAVLAVTALIVLADLAPEQRTPLTAIVLESALPALIVATLLLVPAVLVVRKLFDRYVLSARRLSEHARVMLSANAAHRAPPHGAPEVARLAEDLNALAAAREALQQDVDGRIAEANARLTQERNRLAALMSELAQSVIVCNAEGRILLYNARAVRLLGRTPETLGRDSAHTLVGLGRSIFGIFDRSIIAHALDHVREMLRAAIASPAVTFVTPAPAGQLLRVQLAPVRSTDDNAPPSTAAITGFVLIMDDITQRTETDRRRDLLLQTLTQGTRASLGSMRAAVETMASFPDMDEAARNRFIGVIGDEARRLTEALDRTASEFADALRTEWPLENMRGADLVNAACRRIESSVGLPTKLETIDASIWLKVDSYSLLQAITYIARRLQDEFGVREIRFNLAAEGALAQLDVIWTGAPLGWETTTTWQADPLARGGESSSLALKDIVERHSGEIWYQIHKPSQREFFRIALPLRASQIDAASAPATSGSRPEFYDFDLFTEQGETPELDAQALSMLHFTVFDTETTGLDPSGGDEIVAIAAVRVVNGRVLRHETFQQLVNPGRPMSAEARAITGIDEDLLHTEPSIESVLPAFARFCADTVLVAHNAAFDMRFLHLKQTASGVRFDQPVLDTLLLSSVLHPTVAVNDLEAIAQRMGVVVVGRHTALGDAIMTAEIFARMLPLLAARGIRTLGQARAASQETYLARLTY